MIKEDFKTHLSGDINSSELIRLIGQTFQEGKSSTRVTKEKALNPESIELAAKEIEKEGKRQFYDLQKNWSGYVGYALSAMIIFQFGVMIFLGWIVFAGHTEFTNISTIVVALSVENFAQIVGLAIIVVKFLFPK